MLDKYKRHIIIMYKLKGEKTTLLLIMSSIRPSTIAYGFTVKSRCANISFLVFIGVCISFSMHRNNFSIRIITLSLSFKQYEHLWQNCLFTTPLVRYISSITLYTMHFFNMILPWVTAYSE